MNPRAVPHSPAQSSSFWDESRGPAMQNLFWGVTSPPFSLGAVHLLSPPYHLLPLSAGWEACVGEMVGGRECPGVRGGLPGRGAGKSHGP